MDYLVYRKQLLEVVKKAVDTGLIRLSAGNFSVRTADGNVAITPSGIKYDKLEVDQITIVDLDGNHIDGPCKASSETPMHTAIYRNLHHVNAICHTHSPFAMTFAVLGQEIPIINLETLFCGGPIPVAAWACPGTEAGGEVTVDIFAARSELKAILLKNHGLISIGDQIDEAFEHAFNAEVAAQVYFQAKQIGEPLILTESQIRQVDSVYKK